MHILECIGNVERYLDGKTLDEMKADAMCFHAVVYNIMIIGEAANMLTKEFRNEHPEVPWGDIVGMRNWLVHGYVSTNALYVWDTYKDNLPMLKSQVMRYLDEIKENETEGQP